MIGAGALSPHLVRAHRTVRPIKQVTLWNRTRSRAVSTAFALSAAGIEPDDRVVAYDYVHILRFHDGKAVEHWSVRDDMTLMRQLGALPDRPAAAAASA